MRMKQVIGTLLAAAGCLRTVIVSDSNYFPPGLKRTMIYNRQSPEQMHQTWVASLG